MNRKRAGRLVVIWVLTALLLVLLMACADATYSGTYTPAPPPPVTSAVYQATIEAAEVERYLRVLQAEDTLREYYAQATATAQAEAWRAAAATATTDAIRWQATATADAQREALALQATATAQAYQLQATATAQAVALAAWQATATADAARWQATATAEALALQATATAQALQAQALALQATATAQAVEREAQRARLVYPLRAFGPWVVGLAFLVLLLYAGWRLVLVLEVRGRALRRDARGDAPVLVINQGRQLVVYDPDRSFGPAAVVTEAGVSAPALADEVQQAAVTMRDQAVDLATRGLPATNGGTAQPQRARQAATARLAMGAGAPLVRVVTPADVRPWLRDVLPQALNVALAKGDENEQG